MADGDLSMTVTVTVPPGPLTLVTNPRTGRAVDDQDGRFQRVKGRAAHEAVGEDGQERTGKTGTGTNGRIN